MRRFHIVANWKAHLSWDEAKTWVEQVGPQLNLMDRVTLCPSFAFVRPLALEIKKNGYPIRLGTQTISKYPMGAHTGEVPIDQVADVIEFTLLGHSERKTGQHEDLEIIREQLAQCKRKAVRAVVFFQQASELLKLGVMNKDSMTGVYEPAATISTQHPPAARIQQTIDELDILVSSLRRMFPKQTPQLYYGGSVSKKFLPALFKQEDIHGVVIGKASLKPESFMEIVRGCR